MSMKSRILIAVLGLVLAVGALVGLFVYSSMRIDYSTVDYIESMQKGKNDFLDLANDIGVSSADDLGFRVNGDYNLTIFYGQQTIEVSRPAFESAEYRERIAKIGLEIKSKTNKEDGTIKYRVTYWGEPIDQYDLVY